MDKNKSFKYYRQESDLGLSTSDRRLAFSRQFSYRQSQQDPHTPISLFSNEVSMPLLSRSSSSIDIPLGIPQNDKYFPERDTYPCETDKFSVFRAMRSGNRQLKRLFIMISLNVAYSTAELCIGLFTGRVGTTSV